LGVRGESIRAGGLTRGYTIFSANRELNLRVGAGLMTPGASAIACARRVAVLGPRARWGGRVALGGVPSKERSAVII
jgi:hypothetical protein